jgi:hypothetical protein
MTKERVRSLLVLAAAVALGAAGGLHAGADDGDATISGSLRFNAVFENAGDSPTTYEVSLQHYVLEAGPATVGDMQPLDVDAVVSLCGDKDGCQITLQMFNWDPVGEPGATASKTTWLFLSPSTLQWRFDEPMGLAGVDGDNDYTPTFLFYDCIFTDGESGVEGNQLIDDGPGFGLLNCGGPSNSCAFADEDTVCRVVLRD